MGTSRLSARVGVGCCGCMWERADDATKIGQNLNLHVASNLMYSYCLTARFLLSDALLFFRLWVCFATWLFVGCLCASMGALSLVHQRIQLLEVHASPALLTPVMLFSNFKYLRQLP